MALKLEKFMERDPELSKTEKGGKTTEPSQRGIEFYHQRRLEKNITPPRRTAEQPEKRNHV